MPLSIHFIYSLFLCCTYLYIEYLFAYSYFRPIVKFTQVLWSWDMPTYSLCSNSHMALAWAVNALKRINYTCRLNEDNPMASLQWRHNERYCVSNHRHLDCLLNRLFRRRSTKTSKFRVIDFSRGIHIWPVNSPHKRPVTRKMLPFDEVIVILYHPALIGHLIGHQAHYDVIVIDWTVGKKLLIKIQCLIEMRVKMAFAKGRPCCSGLNILIQNKNDEFSHDKHLCTSVCECRKIT